MDNNKKIKKIGLESEKKAAKKVKGKIIRGSGCWVFNKGDYETNNIVFQNKFTSKTFFVLKKIDLIKAQKDAISKNKDFAISIQMQDSFYYLFDRKLISQDKENKFIHFPLHLYLNKSLKLFKENLDNSMDYLINDQFLVINEWKFNQLYIGV